MRKLINLKISIPAIILIILVAAPVYAVSEAAALFLLISPSPQANAMGETYGNIVGRDPYATIMNPASLGLFAQKHYIGTSFYSEKVNWLPVFANDMRYNSHSTNIGVNLKEINGLPLAVGVGYNHVRLDLGKQIITGEEGPEPIGEIETYDEANSFSLSVAMDYYVRAGIGYSYKSIKSKLAAYSVTDAIVSTTEANANAHDFGLIVQIPVDEIAHKLFLTPTEILPRVQPFFEPGFIYGINNIGDKIVYIDVAQTDPMPRNAMIGINFYTGFKYIGKHHQFDFYSFRWTREANDLLIKTHSDGASDYTSGLKNIDFWDNIIIGKSNDKAITKKGWEFGFCDIFYLRRGRYCDIQGKVGFKSEGWGVNFTQPIKILHELISLDMDNIFIDLLLNLDIEYHHSDYNFAGEHPLMGTEFNSLVIKLKNFPLDF